MSKTYDEAKLQLHFTNLHEQNKLFPKITSNCHIPLIGSLGRVV